MAYVNVADWSPDQVAEWLRGLDEVLQPYVHLFVTKNIDGNRLLHFAPDDFRSLSISCIGHQEIILQAIELLRNIHYQIDQENVQHLALRLSSKARSIYNELRRSSINGNIGEEEEDRNENDSRNDGNREKKKERVSTNVLSGVSDVLSSVKTLVAWLHRNPFHGIEQYDELKSHLLDLSIRLATIAQRDSFAENPVSIIRECCGKLAEIADSIIQDSRDPLILQPAFLDVVTIKKRADDTWGMGLYSSYQGIHQISVLRALSPAHTCGKLMSGDQVVQVNYQTVVGWTSHKLTQLMQENPVQIILTVKKCPMHVNMVTEIYFKPFRLPSKKRTYSPWINNSISNQRYDLQSIPNLQFIKSFDGRSAAQRAINTEPHPKSVTPPTASLNSSGSDICPVTASESDSEDVTSDLDDDAFLSGVEYGSGRAPSMSGRLFQPKPRPHVQRRATIPGATARHTLPFDHLFQGYCHRPLMPGSMGESFNQETYQYVFRENSESPESRNPRPHTCIGTEKKKERAKLVKRDDDGEMPFIDESEERSDADLDELLSPRKVTTSSTSSVEKDLNASTIEPSFTNSTKSLHDQPSPPRSPIETIEELRPFRKVSEERPKLDKSYSSPTYDLDDGDVSTFLDRKPALRPVKEKSPLAQTAEAEMENGSNKTIPENSPSQKLYDSEEIGSPLPPPEGLLSSLSECERIPPNSNTDNVTDIYSHGTDSDNCLSTSGVHSNTSEASIGSHFSVGSKGNFCEQTKGDGLIGANRKLEGVVLLESPRNNEEVSSSKPKGEGYTHEKCFSNVERGKYVDMNKPLTNKPSNDSSNIHEYVNSINLKDQQETNGLVVSQVGNGSYNFSAGVDKDSGVGFTGGGADSPVCVKKLESTPCSPAKVVLRETKSRSPTAWRKGIIIENSGNRRISCRELGVGDHHGWLYRKKDSKSFLLPHRWEKRWFILKKSYLYGYRDKDAPKADSLMYLPGCQVSLTSDVKSKRFAFKVFRSSGQTFYFACETAEERSRWMSQMGVSAISAAGQSEPQQEREPESPEEAYYSETDDELDNSPSSHRSSLSPSRTSPTREGKQLQCNPRLTSPSKNRGGGVVTPTSSRVSPLGSLSSLGSGRQGLRFLQSPKGVMGNPLPTRNFRSYIRVRETAAVNSRSVSEDCIGKENDSGESSPVEAKERKGVGRKGSLRERLKQLPASLTLDRRKQKPSPPQRRDSNALKGVCGSRSETSLLDPVGGSNCRGTMKDSSSCINRSTQQMPSYMRPTHSSALHTDNIDNTSVNGRRGSIGGLSLSSSSLRSVSPRRGSLDCLVAKSSSPPVSPQRSTTGSTGSISAQDEYREGSPEKLWINSLRSPPPQQTTKERDVERLKRTVQYQPLQRSKGESLQMAFELSLSSSPKRNRSPCGLKVKEESQYPQSRPQVPPRTKFLSPSERLVVPSPPSASSSPQTPTSAFRSKAPPNLTLSPPQEEADSPKTPLKPTMGISMIGKQRRTPGALSPREILPEYPGMEYPPTFEPESYSLNPPSEGIYKSPPQLPPRDGLARTASPRSGDRGLSPSQPQFPRKSPGSSSGYVNISHVSNTIAESNVKSYHHNIYVTSPCREAGRETQRRNGSKVTPPPVPPNKPTRKSFSPHQSIQQSNNTLKNSQCSLSPSLSGSQSSSSPSLTHSPRLDAGNEYVKMGANAAAAALIDGSKPVDRYGSATKRREND